MGVVPSVRQILLHIQVNRKESHGGSRLFGGAARKSRQPRARSPLRSFSHYDRRSSDPCRAQPWYSQRKLELLKELKPYLGRNEKSGTKGHVVGWETNKRSRFRLDYAYPDASKTQVGKGTQGVHVNEEDFNRPYGRQRVVHPT
jgi:hypothetical protein